jgi:hypothetical protein
VISKLDELVLLEPHGGAETEAESQPHSGNVVVHHTVVV